MSQIRKMKRQKGKKELGEDKGKKVIRAMIIASVIVVIVVAFLGFRNASLAPTPESIPEETVASTLAETTIIDTDGTEVAVSSLIANKTGGIFVFFLGAA